MENSPNHQRRESATSSNHSIHSAPSGRNIPVARPRARSVRESSIRIRRLPSYNALAQPQDVAGQSFDDEVAQSGRRRSASDPERTHLRIPEASGHDPRRRGGATSALGHEPLPEIVEGAPMNLSGTVLDSSEGTEEKKPLRRHRGRFFRRGSNGTAASPSSAGHAEEEYESGLVDYLDLVDPEVSTLNTLTNVQNSLFVPNLGRFINRRPTYTLTRRPDEVEELEDTEPTTPEEEYDEQTSEQQDSGRHPGVSRQHTKMSISSQPDERYYAILPHGVALEGWSPEDRKELDDHVRHMLHSRRSRFKRSMKGFKQYVSHPLGFFITLYATLITLFGLIWVLFLIGWISVGARKDYIINIIDNILVALFAIMGDGLAPFRAVDTYHMLFIAHYHHLTKKVRRIKSLPPLKNHNDIPTTRREDLYRDVEEGRQMEKAGEEEFSVLSEEQHKKLMHHQEKFSNSHTFYRPHETTTHHAFPIHFLIAAVILLDLHSCLQISLGACTWGISYHDRPFALTTVILCCSITVNITAGIVITLGDRRTRKRDVLELMHKQELTAEAMRKLERKRNKERKRKTELEEPMPPPLPVPEITVGGEDGEEGVHAKEVSVKEFGASGSGYGVGEPMVEKGDPFGAKGMERFPDA